MIIDSHCHLDNSMILDKQEEIINNFEKDNIKLVVNAGCDKRTSENSVKLANKYKKVYAIVGVHPEDPNEFDEEFVAFLEKVSTNKKVLAIGEIGLDYHYENCDKQKQKEVFVKQLEIANRLSLPVVIHLRDAYGDFLDIVKANKSIINNGMLLHCFSGSIEFARQVMDIIPNTYFAFGGSSTFKNAKWVREAAALLPIDRLLTETDAPFLTPEPLRGKEKNQPKFMHYTVQNLADLREMSKSKLEEILEENFYRFFKRAK